MKQEGTPETAESPSKTKIAKRIVPFEESSPAEEPLFINYVQVARAGGSAYVDVGVIALDDILSTSEEATFLVLNRLVMSKQTLSALGQQVTAILSTFDENRQIDIVQE